MNFVKPIQLCTRRKQRQNGYPRIWFNQSRNQQTNLLNVSRKISKSKSLRSHQSTYYQLGQTYRSLPRGMYEEIREEERTCSYPIQGSKVHIIKNHFEQIKFCLHELHNLHSRQLHKCMFQQRSDYASGSLKSILFMKPSTEYAFATTLSM